MNEHDLFELILQRADDPKRVSFTSIFQAVKNSDRDVLEGVIFYLEGAISSYLSTIKRLEKN
jgi:hypothetical protein